MSQVTLAKVLAVGLGLSSPPEYTPSTQITPDSPGSHGEGMAAVTSAGTKPGLLSGHVCLCTGAHTFAHTVHFGTACCSGLCLHGRGPACPLHLRQVGSERGSCIPGRGGVFYFFPKITSRGIFQPLILNLSEETHEYQTTELHRWINQVLDASRYKMEKTVLGVLRKTVSVASALWLTDLL